MPKSILALAALFTLAVSPAFAEDVSATLTRQSQELYDAVSNGDAAVWDKYMDTDAVYVDEAGAVTLRDELIKQIVPLPKGISGEIKVETLQTKIHGDTAVTVHREHETENYFGQILHAEYLTTTVWRQEKDGWKVISVQALAELKDPPAVALLATTLDDYVGTYKLKDGDLTYAVTRDGNKLSGARRGKTPAVLNAEAQDVFFVIGQPRIRKIFLRDANNKVIGLVDRREGRDIVWTKQ